MLFQLIVGPFSTLHTLPRGMSIVLVSLTALIASISLGITGVQVRSSLALSVLLVILDMDSVMRAYVGNI